MKFKVFLIDTLYWKNGNETWAKLDKTRDVASVSRHEIGIYILDNRKCFCLFSHQSLIQNENKIFEFLNQNNFNFTKIASKTALHENYNKYISHDLNDEIYMNGESYFYFRCISNETHFVMLETNIG